MSALATFLRDLLSLLERSGVEYMITGSLASTYYAEPRSTVDVDIVVVASQDKLVDFATQLDPTRFYAPSAELIRNLDQFNVIESATGWKLDVMARRDRPFSVTEFERRRPVEVLGLATYIASPEDVILSKLEWAKASESERQLRDAHSIVEVQSDLLDFGYLRHWARELSVDAVLENLLAH